MLLAAWRTAAWLVGRAIPLDEVVLPPRFRQLRGETRYLFACEPTFAPGAPRIEFRAELASLPIVRRPDEAEMYMKTSLRDLLLAPPRASLHDALRAVLAAASPFADLNVGEAARRLGRSRATLARQLAALGTSFQQIKDELRRDHAIALLADSTLGLADIAERLGYSAASAFQRAFRDWTGVAPGALRSR
jgi:AraC-like DNA-binding protein